MTAQAIPNPLRDPALVTTPSADGPRALHRRLPGYAPTRLWSVPALAERLGVGTVLVKHELERMGLPAFKMLGASWATYRALVERLGRDVEPWETVEELAAALAPLRPLTLSTATDGNHGRAVARMAHLLGFAARIYVPAGTAQARIAAIESEGAAVVVVDGGYDQAVAQSARDADEQTVVVSDTSWEGYTTVPRWVIEGYATIFAEIDEQRAAEGLPAPDVVAIPTGVGAFAAAAVTHHRRPDAPPAQLLCVEPTSAACVLASARAGHVTTLEGPQDSIMAGLNCGTPSPIAWPLLAGGIDWLVTVTDDDARTAMRDLAAEGLVAGESGAAALAGVAVAAPALRQAGQLAADSCVLLLVTEGATDPEGYQAIVGRSAEEVGRQEAGGA